jgi:hypothetical protein
VRRLAVSASIRTLSSSRLFSRCSLLIKNFFDYLKPDPTLNWTSHPKSWLLTSAK